MLARYRLTVLVLVLWSLGNLLWTLSATHHLMLVLGGVRHHQPVLKVLAKLPVSIFLPTPGLPLVVGLLMLAAAVGFAERRLGDAETIVVAIVTNVASTLVVGPLLGDRSLPLLGLPHSQAGVLDTGPSVVVCGVVAAAVVARRWWWALIPLLGGLLIDASIDHDLDSREHLIGAVCGVLLGLCWAAVRAGAASG